MKLPVIAMALVFCLATSARAQGLLWTLPEDGTAVRYEGTYTQVVRRPDLSTGSLELKWTRFLVIKSVGREQAEFRGTMQPCRWIEIKSETGMTSEGVLDAGPGGVRMYKLLVPESEIRGKITTPAGPGRELFAADIPIVKGFRRIGDEAATPMEAGVFQLYPTISLLRHYRKLQDSGAPVTITVPAGEVQGQQLKGEMVVESSTSRSTNTCDLVRTDSLPFGLAKWSVKVVTENKNSTEDRAKFRETVTLTEEMQAVSKTTNAQSDFVN